jgi:Ankyrin repeats (3 copies)
MIENLFRSSNPSVNQSAEIFKAMSAQRDNGKTLLQVAIEFKDTSMVALLLENGAEPDTDDKEAPLIMAIKLGCTDIVSTLLSYGADCEAKDSREWRALYLACRYNQPDIVEVLLANKADISATTQDDGFDLSFKDDRYDRGNMVYATQALQISVLTRSIGSMNVLLRYGADINARRVGISKGDDNPAVAHTVLCLAVHTIPSQFIEGMSDDQDIKNALDILEILLDRQVDVDGISDLICQYRLKDVAHFKGREKLWNRLRALVVEDEVKF